MKIKQEELTKKIEEQDYLQDLETIKYSEITKTKLKKIATKMIGEAVQAFKHNSLIQTQLAISGRRPMTFALESNIINLPFANYKKISRIVRLIKFNLFVNVSHFRIDIFGSSDKIVADPDKYSDLLVKAIEEKIEVIRNYQKPESKTKAKKTK